MPRATKQKSILIIRSSSIGDLVMSLPVAAAIKQQNPNTRITWAVHPEYASLVEGNSNIDHIIPWNKGHWRRLRKEFKWIELAKDLLKTRKDLRSRRFDIAIDLQGKFSSGLLSWLSGALHRIGLGSEEGSNWFMTKTISRNLGDQTQIGSEYRYLANQLGYSDANWKMSIPISKEAEEKATALTQEKISSEPYAVICPFSMFPQKNWPEDHWQQIILRIRGRYKLRTIILGGDNGLDAAKKMARGSGAINLAGQTTLTESAAIIKHASLLIGVDTGLTHMGHALKTPTIALFGATFPYAYAGQERSRVIYLDRYCSPCRRNPTCNKQYTCMKDITPDRVLTEIKPLMKLSENRIN